MGSINTTFDERMRITKESKKKILKNKKFIELFATMKENIGLSDGSEKPPANPEKVEVKPQEIQD